MRIVHVITGLETGGAELMLARMLAHAGRVGEMGEHVAVVSLTGADPAAPASRMIEMAGVPVHALGMRRGVPDPRALIRLTRLLRSLRPGVVQTWLYHADLMGGVAARLAGNIPVVWGLHLGNLAPELNKRATMLTARACARLSGVLPTAIVCCAEATRESHAAIGYRRDRMVVIPNGFDLDTFAPDSGARERLWTDLGLAPDAVLVGLVARFDPQKDHRTFVRAAALLAAVRSDVRFLLCGAGVTSENTVLRSWIDQAGLRGRVMLLGRRDDMPTVQAALDVACSSSLGEAFPLAVGEAMASGVPCVVTNVGDSALIVGDTGRVVPAGDPAALAAALSDVLALGAESRRRLGLEARARMVDQFSLDRMCNSYGTLYARLRQGKEEAAAPPRPEGREAMEGLR